MDSFNKQPKKEPTMRFNRETSLVIFAKSIGFSMTRSRVATVAATAIFCLCPETRILHANSVSPSTKMVIEPDRSVEISPAPSFSDLSTYSTAQLMLEIASRIDNSRGGEAKESAILSFICDDEDLFVIVDTRESRFHVVIDADNKVRCREQVARLNTHVGEFEDWKILQTCSKKARTHLKITTQNITVVGLEDMSYQECLDSLN